MLHRLWTVQVKRSGCRLCRFLPCFFRAALACPTASQGLGMSRKTASATPVTPKPSLHTSWFLTVTRWSTRCSLNSSATFWARCSWNSTVWRWPVGATVRRMAWEREPLPVPGTNQEGEEDTVWGKTRIFKYFIMSGYINRVVSGWRLDENWTSCLKLKVNNSSVIIFRRQVLRRRKDRSVSSPALNTLKWILHFQVYFLFVLTLPEDGREKSPSSCDLQTKEGDGESEAVLHTSSSWHHVSSVFVRTATKRAVFIQQ